MAYSRNEYLQSLNRMRSNYQNQGNPLINREDDNGNVGNELSAFAYMNTDPTAPEQASKSERNGWQRTVDTIHSGISNVTEGVSNFLDDIGDAVMTIGSWFSGLFSGIGSAVRGEGFEKGWNEGTAWLKDATSYEWEHYLNQFWNQMDFGHAILSGDMFTGEWGQRWADMGNAEKNKANLQQVHQNSWASEWGDFGQGLQKVEQGVGYILPSLVLAYFTGGTSLGAQIGIQAGVMGASALGGGVEKSLKEGADYGKAMGYGLAKGAVSAGLSAVTTWIGGNAVLSKGGTAVSNLGKKAGAEFLKATGSKTAEVVAGKAVEIATQAGISGARAFAMTMAEPAFATIYNDKSLAESYSGENLSQTFELAKESAVTAMATSAVIGTLREGADYAKYGKDGYYAKYYAEKANMYAKQESRKLEQNAKAKEKALAELDKRLEASKGGMSKEDYMKAKAKIEADFQNKTLEIKNNIESKVLGSIRQAQEYYDRIVSGKYTEKEATIGHAKVKNPQELFNAVSQLSETDVERFQPGDLDRGDFSFLRYEKDYGVNDRTIKTLYALKQSGMPLGSNKADWYVNSDGTVSADLGQAMNIRFDDGLKTTNERNVIGLLTLNKNGKETVVPIQVGEKNTFVVKNPTDVSNSLTVLSQNVKSDLLPTTVEVKPSIINVPDVKTTGINTSLPYKISKEVSSKILNKSNSNEIMKFLESGLKGRGKNNYVMQAKDAGKYFVVEPYNSDGTQRYGIITVDSKTNEILDITVKTTKPSLDRAYIVPKMDEHKLLTTKLENPDGTAKVYDINNVDYDWDVSAYGDEYSVNAKPLENRGINEGGFIYSKNPLKVADFRKEIPFARVAKLFNIPSSLEKTYELKLKDSTNELAVLRWLAKRNGTGIEQVLTKLGYDSIVKNDNSVTFFNYGNALRRGVEFSHGKRSENYSDLIKRNVSENTRKELARYTGENGKELKTEKDGFEYSKLIRETLSYSVQKISYDGESYEVKIVDRQQYTPDMQRVVAVGKKIGVRTRFALRLQEADKDTALQRVSAYWKAGGKDIIIFVDSGRRGTLEQTAMHELGHAIFDKLHGWDLLDIKSRIAYLEKNHPQELLKKRELYTAIWDNYDAEKVDYDNMIYEEMFVDTYAGLCEWEDKDFQNKLIADMKDLYEKGSKYANKRYYEMLAREEAEDYGRSYTDRAEIEKGASDEFRKLQEESRRELSDKSWEERSGKVDDRLRGRLSRILGKEIKRRGYGNGNDNGLLTLKGKGDHYFSVFEKVDGATFHDIFEIARTYLENGELVDLHTAEEYNDTYNYLSKDGMSGFVITKDGDLISVFNAGSKRGWLRAIAPIIKEKAKTLDCYASPLQNLPEMYNKMLGFQTASLMDWNGEYDHDGIGARHSEPKVAFMVLTDKEVTMKTFGKDDYDGAVTYRNSLVPKQTSTPKSNRPTYREIIKSNANLKHEKVYSLKTTDQIVDNALVNMLNKWDNAIKITIPTGARKLKNFTFEELNLYKNKEKAIENIVNEIEKAVVTFDNGTNGQQKVVLKDLGMHDDLVKAVKGLVAHKGDLSEKSKWVQHYYDTLRRYAGYVHERAQLTSEYVTAIKAQGTLKKIFEDTRSIKIGGDTIVQELTLYKNMVKGFLTSKSDKNVAPSSFTNLVNNFKDYTPENYADFYDATLKNAVEMLRESFVDGKFPDREPTLNEMKLFNAIRGRILSRCRELASEKHQAKIKTAENGAKLASVALPATKPGHYGKIKGALDSDLALPIYLRKYLGHDHPLVKHLTDEYLKVSASQISTKNKFERFVTEDLSKKAGYKKYGALLKDLKAKIDYKITDRDGKQHKFTVDDVVSAYWTYRTNKDQLLATGMTAYDSKTHTDIDFKFTDADYQKMFAKLPAKVKSWADYVFDEYFNGMDYDYKVAIIEKYFGISNLLEGSKGNYAPTFRVGQVNMGIGATSQFDAGYLSTMLQGFLKTRVKNKNHFRWMGATDLLEQNMTRVSGWGEKSQWVEDLRVMLNTTVPSLGNHTLEYYLDKNVPEWKGTWSNYMTKIVLGKPIIDQKGSIIETIGNVGQVATLGFNFLGSVPKQLLSDFSWALDERVTWGAWVSTIPEAITNFFRMGSIKKELMENNGYFIERFNHGDVIKAIMNGKLPNKIAQFVLKPMEWLDSVVVSTHGYALAKRIVNAGIKDGTYTFAKNSPEYKKEVAHVLHGLTLISQSNSDPMFMSRLRSGDVSAIARDTVGRFHSDNQNKYQGLMEITAEKKNSDTRRKAYEKEAEKAETEEEKNFWKEQADKEAQHFKKNYGKKIASFLAVILLNGIGATAISLFKRKFTGKEDWDEFKAKDLLIEATLESTVNWLPYIGTIANAIENNSDVSSFTVEKLNNLVDTVQLVIKAFETGKETDVRRAIVNLIKNGLELTGVPANNIYQLFMGIWYQINKEGSLEAQSWVKGYSSSYMKSQYSEYIKNGNIKRAKAQLGAWSSMYSTNITDEATLDELVRLSEAGYNATPSANATSYTDENGTKIAFTSAQANAYKAEYAKSNEDVSELLKIEGYKKQDDKVKASLISKIYSAYKESAQARALGIAPTSKLGKLLYYTDGNVNLAKYIMSMQQLSVITEDKKHTRKENVITAINKLSGFSKQEKLLLAYLSGYSVSEKNQNQMMKFLISKGFDTKTAKTFLGLDKK